MFKYARELNKAEILKLEEEISSKRDKQIENNKEINRITKLLKCYTRICDNRKTILISGIIALIGLVGVISGVSLGISTCFLIGNSCLVIYNVQDIKRLKNHVRNNYSDMLEFNLESLINKIEELNCINNNIDEDFERIHAKISYHENELVIINRFENDMNLLNESYYVADSKEQYETLNKLQNNNMFNDFLEDKVDYSNIYFENGVDNKRLIKNKITSSR